MCGAPRVLAQVVGTSEPVAKDVTKKEAGGELLALSDCVGQCLLGQTHHVHMHVHLGNACFDVWPGGEPAWKMLTALRRDRCL